MEKTELWHWHLFPRLHCVSKNRDDFSGLVRTPEDTLVGGKRASARRWIAKPYPYFLISSRKRRSSVKVVNPSEG
jgi:hypothetical protein